MYTPRALFFRLLLQICSFIFLSLSINQFITRKAAQGSTMEYLRDPELSIDSCRRQLKTFLFAQY